MNRFWMWLMIFAYRRLKVSSRTIDGNIPAGVPGMRDPNAECSGYTPRKRDPGDWECYGDGHYLCKNCAIYSPKSDEQRDESLSTNPQP